MRFRTLFVLGIVAIAQAIGTNSTISATACFVRCPSFAPIFSAKNMMCQEESVHPVAIEDVLDWGNLKDIVAYVFASIKDEVIADKNRDLPDCNWSANLEQNLPIDSHTHDLCSDKLTEIREKMGNSTIKLDRDEVNMVIFCRGNFQFGDFPYDDYVKAIGLDE